MFRFKLFKDCNVLFFVNKLTMKLACMNRNMFSLFFWVLVNKLAEFYAAIFVLLFCSCIIEVNRDNKGDVIEKYGRGIRGIVFLDERKNLKYATILSPTMMQHQKSFPPPHSSICFNQNHKKISQNQFT